MAIQLEGKKEFYDLLREHFEEEEGVRAVPYRDTLGHLTIGIGHNLAKPISKAAILQIFADDLDDAITEVKTLFYGYWDAMTDGRKLALISMCFQLGQAGLQEFRHMIRAIQAGKWEEAAKEALESQWAVQTPARAQRIALMLETGDIL